MFESKRSDSESNDKVKQHFKNDQNYVPLINNNHKINDKSMNEQKNKLTVKLKTFASMGHTK